MALQFQTIGFINFNKEYNKVLKSGAVTVSFTASAKNKDGEYETQYFNGLIPAKHTQKAKPFLNKELVKISGIATKTKKGYREIKCGLWLNADDPAAFGWQVKNVKIPQALDYDQWKANEKKKADEKKKQEQESIKATIKRMENELAQLKKIIKTEE